MGMWRNLVDATDLKSVEVKLREGSSPSIPHHLLYWVRKEAPVAQLDRASDYGSEGYGFDSCRARHLIYNYRDVAQLGSAPGLGPGGRRFESCHPDHF